MKKLAFFGAMYVLLATLAGLAKIWVIVEFIIYLVKDTPFNFTSLWVFGILVVLAILSFVGTFISAVR